MVSVIIPTLFPTEALGQYAKKLTRYKGVKEVIVVVNGEAETPSPPPRVAGELPQGSKSFPREGVVWNFLGKNLGFTGACNAGAKAAVGDLILFLNDDCELTEEAFSTLVDFMEKNVDVVATQPIVKKQILNSKSEILREVQTPISTKVDKNEILKRVPRYDRDRQDDTRSEHLIASTPESLAVENIGFWVDARIGKAIPETNASIFNSQFSNYKQTQGQHQKNEIPNQAPRYDRDRRDDKRPDHLDVYSPENLIYGLSGTCLLIRKDIFMKIGMWDESFHSYLEDVDLAIRLYKAGYKVAPCLDAEVTHEHMATSSKMGLYKEKQDVMNWWRLVFKHPDVFLRPSTIFPLLLERGRNMSGLLKKMLHA